MNATRRRYNTSSKEQQELLTARKKVILTQILQNLYEKTFKEDELTYNALEKDIAVVNLYFGASSVQGNIYQACDFYVTQCIIGLR